MTIWWTVRNRKRALDIVPIHQVAVVVQFNGGGTRGPEDRLKYIDDLSILVTLVDLIIILSDIGIVQL